MSLKIALGPDRPVFSVMIVETLEFSHLVSVVFPSAFHSVLPHFPMAWATVIQVGLAV